MTEKKQDLGVPASPSGHEASPSAPLRGSSQSRVPNATVYAAAALSSDRRGSTHLAARISFVSEADALGLAILAVEMEGFELVSHHTWWEDWPASGIEAATADETRSGSAAGESPTRSEAEGDARTPQPPTKEE